MVIADHINFRVTEVGVALLIENILENIAFLKIIFFLSSLKIGYLDLKNLITWGMRLDLVVLLNT